MFFSISILSISTIFFFFVWKRTILPIWAILLVSAFLRLFFVFNFASSFSSDIYSFLTTGHVLLQNIPIYPAMYFPFIFYLGALSIILGKYIAPLIFLKLIFSLFDVGISYILYKLTKDSYSALLYALNPVMLIIITIHGQLDSLPLFLLLWSLYSFKAKNEIASALLMGITIAVKPWPLLFLPFFVKKARSPFLFVLSLLVPGCTVLFHSFITNIPILQIIIPIKDYRGIYGVWGIGNIMYTLFPLFWDEAIKHARKIFLLGFGLISLINYKKSLLPEFLFIMLTFFVFSPLFGAQWISWMVPFILILRPSGWGQIMFLMTVYSAITFATDVITPNQWFILWKDTIVNAIGLILWVRLCFTYMRYRKEFFLRKYDE